ncbi:MULTISPECIES: RtcB family protein [Bacillus cereus group]|uniref:RtcB family protein n=1 Tax=Bacillus cereus group TaxID=86661 RepID=UPI0008FDB3BD|nr:MULTISPECIES: RtcB family protein [Bacillus cereus group]MDG1621505.1 RtcB family protein [Bacillus mobilis]MDX5836009.1 RtcB family protein [Bacillus cereus group sp. BfR-BA-01700]MED4384813.1 RtcB family protein [Bacillus mobilis]OJE37141.1 RNA-splicing ligase RtcB [Bacillus mobilis]HDR7244468.1 RtcB family protein [Bacillus mobilis]
MLKLQGKYNEAKVFTNNVDETATGQIIDLCNQEFVKDSQIRIMPDTHAGAGCTIGTTMTIQDKIVPNLVGVDIGCGMEVVVIDKKKEEINFDCLDETIRKFVPSGFRIRDKEHRFSKMIDFDSVKAPYTLQRAQKSIGTLGGGNHFIELNEDEKGNVYIVIHSGSRNLGKQIAEYYQNFAYEQCIDVTSMKDEIIKRLTEEGRAKEIQETLRGIQKPKIRKELAYLEGQGFKDYMNDMNIAQKYAALNRKAMIDEIVTKMDWKITDQFTTIHNYIDIENMILRKGAISAQKDERVIIPINMRDGSIIAFGKGNPDWNFSGPHGAGRIMSRKKAKELLSLEEFQNTMTEVWTTSVVESTIDEAPMVYKPMDEIIENTKETIDIKHIIKPLYNFKAN